MQQNATTAADYAYDFLGNRVWRETFGAGAGQTNRVWDHERHLLAQHDATTGDVQSEYVWIDDMPVAMLTISGATVTTQYVHTGQIEEPLAVTTSSQSIAWNAYVDPYGTATTFGTPTTSIALRLPGQWYGSETSASGLNQNQWRDYDPSLGRYIEADPLGIDAGQNLYAYVDGDPLNWTDLLGLRPGIYNWLPRNTTDYNNANSNHAATGRLLYNIRPRKRDRNIRPSRRYCPSYTIILYNKT